MLRRVKSDHRRVGHLVIARRREMPVLGLMQDREQGHWGARWRGCLDVPDFVYPDQVPDLLELWCQHIKAILMPSNWKIVITFDFLDDLRGGSDRLFCALS